MLSDNTSNLSIIAVRILPQCHDSVQKCLKENVFYYLNRNFDISENGNTITPLEGYVEVSNNTFFNQDEIFNENDEKPKSHADSTQDPSKPNISISAIVGKNGDGKSSLVEFMIRIINNFACKKGLNPHRHLVYVEGVCGELYFLHDNRSYRIKIDKRGIEHVRVHEYKWNRSIGSYKLNEKELTEQEIKAAAFYTLVSNYSHFAYNTEEFIEENLQEAGGEHWLRNLFHKNDAYQVPLNLHPYRDKGNIDINRERLLSTQRLLTSIAGCFKRYSAGVYVTELLINGKRPYELRLRDIGKSKLQTLTLRKYFLDNNKNLIDGEIKRLRDSEKIGSRSEHFFPIVGDYTGTALSYLSEYYLSKQFMRFAVKAIEWLEAESLLNEKSDISQLLDTIKTLNKSIPSSEYVHINMVHDRYLKDQHMKKWRRIGELSAVQFLRFALVFDVCRMWNKVGIISQKEQIKLSFDPAAIFKHYDEMSYSEKACHYIIYKTIEIFLSYPSYGDPLKMYESPQLFFRFRGIDTEFKTLYPLGAAFDRLSLDWHQKSHNTLKLRQAYRYLMVPKSSRSLYSCVGRNRGKTIVFEKLAESQIRILSDTETLPPPIFKWEIMFRQEKAGNLIPLNTFSSGEKQKLFFQGAIIYHLLNINSVGVASMHYHAVNLIFEEIELYFHPEWQRTLIFDLMKAIRSANIPKITSINMIFVTHSPYILSDIPKSNVLFLKDGRPTYEMQENTFGANINSLLKNGFFLPSLPMGEFAYRKINTLFYKLHNRGVNRENINQMYAEIMTVGEPAIRMQLMTLLAPYRHLFISKEEIAEFIKQILND